MKSERTCFQLALPSLKSSALIKKMELKFKGKQQTLNKRIGCGRNRNSEQLNKTDKRGNSPAERDNCEKRQH